MKIKTKASWFKLFRLILIKINYSFVTIFLFIFSIIISGLSISTLFLLDLPAATFFITFQYYVMIFYSILLFIFILLNAIKLFGIQFEDSSFLLLLTKPYSRSTIILTQYLALFFMSLLFITINNIVLLTWGSIIGSINHTVYLYFYVKTILNLFAFCLLFTMLITFGVVSMLAISPSQIVFLIFVIFCSLFLLGGLPYSLTKINSDIINLDFDNNKPSYSVNDIKTSILFREYLQQGLIKYPHLTTAIANFYDTLNDSELDDITHEAVVTKRINFYQSLGLINPQKVIKTFTGTTTNWKPVAYINKEINIKITFTTYFHTLTFLQNHHSNDPIIHDLINIIGDYDNKYNINIFMAMQESKVPELLTYDDTNTYLQTKGDSTTKPLTANKIKDIFKSIYDYKFSFRTDFNSMFYNPVYILIRTVEENIYTQINIYRQIENNPIIKSKAYLQYINHANIYQIIYNLNVIEHWNQLWTYFMGYYGDFWFEPDAQSKIDFDSQKNTLFSYSDFKLNLKDKKIDVQNIEHFQNNNSIIKFYYWVDISLFLFSYLKFMRKIVS